MLPSTSSGYSMKFEEIFFFDNHMETVAAALYVPEWCGGENIRSDKLNSTFHVSK